MQNLIIYILLVLIPFIIGKTIASTNKPLIKKILKFKRYKNITDRMINNYYGNLVSMVGINVFSALIFGIDSIIFFAILALTIFVSYIFNVSNSTGLSLDETISLVISGNIFKEKTSFFKATTFCCIISIVLTGFIATSFISPYLLKDIKHMNASCENSSSSEIFDVTNNNESEFYEELDKYFN